MASMGGQGGVRQRHHCGDGGWGGDGTGENCSVNMHQPFFVVLVACNWLLWMICMHGKPGQLPGTCIRKTNAHPI